MSSQALALSTLSIPCDQEKVTFNTPMKLEMLNCHIDIPTLLNKFVFLFDFTKKAQIGCSQPAGLANGLDQTGMLAQANPEVRCGYQMINRGIRSLYDLRFCQKSA